MDWKWWIWNNSDLDLIYSTWVKLKLQPISIVADTDPTGLGCFFVIYINFYTVRKKLWMNF